eukprot:scaffold1439_cov108-Skeletonema_menzelii.AAC.1
MRKLLVDFTLSTYFRHGNGLVMGNTEVAASLLASTLSASAFHSSHYIRQGGCNSVLLFRQRACAGDNIIKRFPSKASLSSTSLSNTPTGPSFCEKCGTPTQLQVPEGDERERH